MTLIAKAGISGAHAHEPHDGEPYQCTDRHMSLKIIHCSNGNPALCDVQRYKDGVAEPLVRVPSGNANELLRQCIGSGARQAGSISHSADASPAARIVDANGFRIGDSVSVIAAGGAYPATVLRADGSSYLVRPGPGIEVWKIYPKELRRIGALTEIDKAHGLFALHETVEVYVEGDWIEGEIIAEMGMEYEIALPGNRTISAAAQRMRRISFEQHPPAPGAAPR